MTEQGLAHPQAGQSALRHRGDVVGREARDWPLAAPIFVAAAGIYAAAVLGIYVLVASASTHVLVSGGRIALILAWALYAVLFAIEVDRHRRRMASRAASEPNVLTQAR